MNTNTWEFLRRNPSITLKNCLENSPKQLGMIQGGESPFKGFVGISGDMKPLMVVVGGGGGTVYVPEVQLPLKSNFLRRVVFVATEKIVQRLMWNFRVYMCIYIFYYTHYIYIHRWSEKKTQAEPSSMEVATIQLFGPFSIVKERRFRYGASCSGGGASAESERDGSKKPRRKKSFRLGFFWVGGLVGICWMDRSRVRVGCFRCKDGGGCWNPFFHWKVLTSIWDDMRNPIWVTLPVFLDAHEISG